MSGDAEYLQQPNSPNIRDAQVDLAELLFRCHQASMTVQQALNECKTHGIKSISLSDIDKAYKELNDAAAWLNEKLKPQLTSREN